MIQVRIPASAKDFDYNTEVELINPVADTIATATYMRADVDWYIKAENVILKKIKSNNPYSVVKETKL